MERRPSHLKLYQRRLEGDQVMQQRQIDDQLLDLAHKDRQLLYLRDEVDGREASISKLHKKLVKYRLNLDSTKEDRTCGSEEEDEDANTLSDVSYSFEHDSVVKGCSSLEVAMDTTKSSEHLMSPRRKISGSIKRIIRRTTMTSMSSDAPATPTTPVSPARSIDLRRRWSTSSDKENHTPIGIPDSPTRMSGVAKQPTRGEKRHVYLNTRSGKYGFRLQSYGRVREQGKVLQTFVQSVATGSPSHLAGLYPGDAIVEVNGLDVKYSPMDFIVEAIKKEATKGDRVLLKVVFVDGVTRIECMKKMDDLRVEIKKKQGRLKELLEQEEKYCPAVALDRISSPAHTSMASDLPVWEASPPNFDPVNHTFPYNRQLNQLVAVHHGNITGLECDSLIMPSSSCQKSAEEGCKNLLLQLLKTGGSRLLDQLSLSRQCKIGYNLITRGHGIRAKHIYHCVFGDLEESLQSCCYKALGSAREEKLSTIVFWLDGFAFLSVSPQIIIEAARHWLQQDATRNSFLRVVFSSKANPELVDRIMRGTFPLYPTATSNRGSYCGSTDTQSLEGDGRLTSRSSEADLGKRDSVFSEDGGQGGVASAS